MAAMGDPTSMKIVPELPNEVLRQIFSHLTREALNNVFCVSKTFQTLAVEFLLQADNLSPDQKVLLKAQLQRYPNLRDILSAYGPVRMDSEGHVLASDYNDVQSFTRLGRLQLQMDPLAFHPLATVRQAKLAHTPERKIGVLAVDVLNELKEVSIKDDDRGLLSLAMLHTFMQLPNVKTLRVLGIANSTRGNEHFMSHVKGVSKKLGMTKVTRLELSGVWKYAWLELSHLEALLSHSPSLSTLSCTDLFLSSNTIVPKLDRAVISRTLKHVASTLRSLTLTNPVGDAVPLPCPFRAHTPNWNEVEIHGPRVDFSGFPVLKYVRLDAEYILAPPNDSVDHGRNSMEKNMLFGRLPRELETIEIICPSTQPIFTPIQGPTYTTKIIPSQYNFLFQFPTHARMYFPKLRHVAFIETLPDTVPLRSACCGVCENTVRRCSIVLWDQPMELRDAFKEAKISLDVLVRHWTKEVPATEPESIFS